MGDTLVGFNSAADAGEKFTSAAVRAEIEGLAPTDPGAGSVTESKLANGAVTNPKLGAGAVDTTKIAALGVKTGNLDNAAVTSGKIAAGAVTPDKLATGAVKAVDAAGAPITLTVVPVTAVQYAAISSKDPNTLYLITT